MADADSGILLKRNDLVIVTVFMIMMIFFILASEDPTWAERDFEIDHADIQDGDGEDRPVEIWEEDLVSKGGQTTEGGATDTSFTIDDERAVEIRVELEWTDDVGDNDELGLVLSNSSGELDSTSGTTGSLSITYKAGLDEELVGDFEVSVQAIDCPGLVGPSPFNRDFGNDWSLKVVVVLEGVRDQT